MSPRTHDDEWFFGMHDAELDDERKAQELLKLAVRFLRISPRQRRTASHIVGQAAMLSDLRRQELIEFELALTGMDLETESAIHDHAPNIAHWNEAILSARQGEG